MNTNYAEICMVGSWEANFQLECAVDGTPSPSSMLMLLIAWLMDGRTHSRTSLPWKEIM